MILVTGATGNVGRELIAQLRAANQAVRALVRAPGAVGEVDTAVADLDQPASLEPALRGVRGVFLLGGHRDMPGVVAELGRAGVERVVLLSSRSVIGGDPDNAIVEMWLASEAAVRASGLAWTIVRPSGFHSNTLRWRSQLRAGDVVRVAFADVAIAAIDPYDIAAVAAAALTSDGHAARSHELSGPAPVTPADQLQVLAGVLARPLRLEPLHGDAARAELARTFPPRFVDAQLRFFAAGEFDDARVVATVAELTGRAPRTFAQWAAAHADEFPRRAS